MAANVIDKTTSTIVIGELDKLRKRIIDNLNDTSTTASGATAKSLRVDTTGAGAALYGRGYFQTTEKGRKAGKVPYKFIDILSDWVDNKGFSFANQKEKTQTVKAIYWSIVKKGTLLFRKGGRKDIYSTEVPQTIQAIKSQIMAAFVEKLTTKSIPINR